MRHFKNWFKSVDHKQRLGQFIQSIQSVIKLIEVKRPIEPNINSEIREKSRIQNNNKMVLFKAIVVGLLAWQLLLQLRRRREQQQPAEPTFVFIPPDNATQKDTSLLNQRGPPPKYDAAPIKN